MSFMAMLVMVVLVGALPARWVAIQPVTQMLRDAFTRPVPAPDPAAMVQPVTHPPQPVSVQEPASPPASIPAAAVSPPPEPPIVPFRSPQVIAVPTPAPVPVSESPAAPPLQKPVEMPPQAPAPPVDVPKPKALGPPEIIEVRVEPSIEAKNAIQAAKEAAAAAVARFAREDRTAIRNPEYMAGEAALKRAERHLLGERYSDAQSEASAARKSFERARPIPWETTPIVVEN